jgi:FkbM family methyltransferase
LSRKFINCLIFVYLLPLKLSSRLALYIKGRILTFNEHYLVTLDTIRRNFPAHTGIVVDIGAFDADSTVFLAKALRGNMVFGFEPNPVPYEQGKKNAKRFSNIKLYNLGFSNQVGEVDLHVTKNLVSSSLYHIKDESESPAENVIKVKVDTLDNFFSSTEEILLIKFDVQGAELAILKKGEETLKKTKLVLTEMLIADMYVGACAYHEVDSFLRERNFEIHTIITNYNKDGIKYFDALYIKKP